MILKKIQKNKTAIWGLGQEGLSVLRYLRHYCPDKPFILLSDTALSEETLRQLESLKPYSLHIGQETKSAIMSVDVAIHSPGVSIYRSEIKEAAHKGVSITSPTNLFFEEAKTGSTIGITGTKGKSTTSSLVAHLLKKAGLATAYGGNIGIPLLDLMQGHPNYDYWVMELSSYQTCDLEYSPDIGLLLNLYPEHIDWHQTHENYYNDKLNLFKHRTESQLTILNYQDKLIRDLTSDWSNIHFFNHKDTIHFQGNYLYDGHKKLISTEKLPLKGGHNKSNFCAALSITKSIGFDPEEMCAHFHDFKGLPHRLELLGQKNNIAYINDSLSTTPETAIAALKTTSPAPTTMIVGGYDRNQDYQELAKALTHTSHIKNIICLFETGPRIADHIKYFKNKFKKSVNMFEVRLLDEAVKIAQEITEPGGIILFSPAAPSYDKYSDFAERGIHFAKLCGFNRSEENNE